MTKDISKTATTGVSTVGSNAVSDAADTGQVAGPGKGSRESPNASRERSDPRRFDITFRQLRDEDLPLMHRWLNDPAVVQWWEGTNVSWPAVVSRYGSGHSAAIEHWIALLEGEPFGWAQCYCAADVAEKEAYHWKGHLELRETAGIDCLVGEPTRRRRGAGSAMIRAFVQDVVFMRHVGIRRGRTFRGQCGLLEGAREGRLSAPGPSRR